jgi:hypothetical protein
MNSSGLLKIELLEYWHAGGGRGGGSVLDAVVHRDSLGLPVVPGRHLKGLLRDAAERAEAWGWQGCSGLAECLFGSRTENLAAGALPVSGCLRIGDARLPADLAAWLGSEAGEPLRPRLFHSLYALAVEHGTGTAKDRSLRGYEVVIPLQLEAGISVVPGTTPPQDWQATLERLLPLVDAVGAHRSRGLGRAVLTMEANR